MLRSPVWQAVFNAFAYRDAANTGDNAFLPSIIQGQVQSLLGVPFSDRSYRDTTKYPSSAFLPRVIQGKVQSLLGAPFSTGSYRDTRQSLSNAFLPQVVQGRVQSLLGAPFAGLGYRDSFIAPVSQIFYVPPAAFVPFFGVTPNVPFNPQQYIDQTECLREEENNIVLCANQNAIIRIAIQDGFGGWLSPPFQTGYFTISLGNQVILDRNTNEADARFISFVQGQWYLEINIPASDTRHIPIGAYYYNSTLGPNELESGLLQIIDCNALKRRKRHYPVNPIPLVKPFFNPLQFVRFDPMTYRTVVENSLMM